MRRRHLLGLAAGTALVGCESGPVSLREVPPHRPPEVELRRIALVSCIDQAKPQRIWTPLLEAKPDLALFAGDNVYGDKVPFSLDALEQAYDRQAAVPGFARLRRAVPHLAIWDDHDYGLNDGGVEFEHKWASKQAFLRFWEAAENDPRRTREGLYSAETFGPPGRRVQVILLDTRWFRSRLKPTDRRNAAGRERYLPDDDPARTMLGEAQWRWLEAQLKVPAQLRFIVSSVQVVVEGHGWERWGNFPRERERLYRLVASTGATGVVFLSGDRHIGALYRQAEGVPYPFTELTSSGVTHTWQGNAEAGPNRIGAPFTELHYALADIDWRGRSLRLQLHDALGQPQRSHAVPFDELRIPS